MLRGGRVVSLVPFFHVFIKPNNNEIFMIHIKKWVIKCIYWLMFLKKGTSTLVFLPDSMLHRLQTMTDLKVTQTWKKSKSSSIKQYQRQWRPRAGWHCVMAACFRWDTLLVPAFTLLLSFQHFQNNDLLLRKSYRISEVGVNQRKCVAGLLSDYNCGNR